jgi:enoyl-[acyl-carrier-protein] reductase (NADH)
MRSNDLVGIAAGSGRVTAPRTNRRAKVLQQGKAVLDHRCEGDLGPGYIKTQLNKALVEDETFSAWLIGRTPMDRGGEVDGLVGAAIFLASDASSFVNGHILYVDGGITACI